MEKIKCDLCIIGAGSGGLSIAAGAAQMGAKVVLIEGHKMGGDCLNYGCVPSKSLIASAKAAYGMAHTGSVGVTATDPQVDYAAAKDHVQNVIDSIAPVDSQERFEGFGITVLRDFGSFKDKDTIVAGDHEITARRIVIATGSSPFVPPIEGLDAVDYLTNETLFELREKPEHLIIIGAGPIGMEMAQAHRRLGCEVTVIEGAKAMANDDPEAVAVLLEQIRSEGVTLIEGQQAKRINQSDGKITVETEGGSYTGSHLLIAVGRKVNIDKLDLAKGGVEHDRAVKVDARLRSVSNKRVFAVGDAAGGMQFTHLAGYHAGVVIPQIMFGLPTKARTNHIPWATYTAPELAHVGLTQEQAQREHGGNVQTVRFDYHENDRAIASEKTAGFVKVLVVRGRPVGATIVGESAGELISMWSMAIANGLKLKAISDTVLPYPTLAEINKRAAGAYFSPLLFQNDKVKTVVRLVQKWLP